ncbi:FGGY-family carbohydrate kinase [Bacillus pacificus]
MVNSRLKRKEFPRCILESLSFKYRWVLEKLEVLTGKSIEVIHMGGGGIQNDLFVNLPQMRLTAQL